MRPLTILIIAEAALLAFGVANLVPAYAATVTANGDGVTVLAVPSAPQAAAQPSAPQIETVTLDNGDIVQAAAGSLIAIQLDPKSGHYTIGVGQ